MIAACVESKFYTDDVDDDVSMTALRLLTKDLLILFTCVNEGMINILEHYFEMSHSDATTALKIYKTFCRDTEKVVAYLGIAKKLYNVLNVPIPNLKHAPVSLAGSLEEYLNDPNFEKNRQEYKENKRVADGGKPATPQPAVTTPTPSASASTSSRPVPSSSSASTSTAPTITQPPAKSFTDFFESIEQSQTSMFPGSPSMNGTLSSQMTGGNPFGMMGMGMGGGGGGGFGAFPGGGGGIQPQFTGFQPSQQAPNPFLQPQFTGFVPPPPQQQPFMQPQFTGFAPVQPLPMMQPQMTGFNPFRQSMMPTGGGGGGSPFGGGGGGMQPQMTGNPFPQQQQQQPFLQPQSTGFSQPPSQQRPMSMLQPQSTGNPFLSQPQRQQAPPSRQSTLSPSFSSPSLPTIPQSSTSSNPAPLVAQKTGARNPFAPAPGTLIPQTPEPEPKGPSMNELAFTGYQSQSQPPQQFQNGSNGGGGQSGQNGGGSNQQEAATKKPQDAFSRFLEQQKTGTQPLTAQKTGGLFASIASDFTMNRSQPEHSNSFPPPSFPPSTSSFSTLSLNSNSTPSYLNSQPTGTSNSFASQNGRKAFQPTSSFGSTLFNEFSSSSSSTPASTAPNSSFSPSTTTANGTTSPQPLQPQATGYNPFAGSKLPPLNSSLGGNGSAFGAFGSSGTGGNNGGAGGVTTGSLI